MPKMKSHRSARKTFKLEAVTYLTKAAKYGMSDSDIKKGFAAQGWSRRPTKRILSVCWSCKLFI